jgi:hypothetical protein
MKKQTIDSMEGKKCECHCHTCKYPHLKPLSHYPCEHCTPQKPPEADWEKKFDKEFGTEQLADDWDYTETRNFKTLFVYPRLKTFISQTIEREREKTLKELELKIVQSSPAFLKPHVKVGYLWALENVSKVIKTLSSERNGKKEEE